MSVMEAGARAPENLWRSEIKAMVALAWPMVLTNLGQTAMTATDVMMMGLLGPKTLAAGALGSNLYFMLMIFGLGLMLATSPMMATELGRKRHSVRDIRRTVLAHSVISFFYSASVLALTVNILAGKLG